ncbi:MAG: hypothetical protein F6K28_36205 [Microcoleus sp. SIO2G3]|nr:hypothetical protein [Microcoleus sp. SIO2G3]
MLKATKCTAVISLLLLALTTACASSEQSQNTSTPSTPPKAINPTPKPVASKAPKAVTSKAPKPQPESFQEALDAGMGAAVIAQSAESQDDWDLVINRWQSAIKLLKTVSKPSPNYATAQKKITEYQRNLAYAQQQKNNPSKPTLTASSSPVVAPPQQASSRQTKPSPSAIAVTSKQTPTSTVSPEVALALHLKKLNAKMYGAYWCPACTRQKEEFGEEAFKQINYIECDPAGENARLDLCRKASISSYPTWEVNGQLYTPGSYSLEALADLSGYQDVQNLSQ